MKKHSSKFLLTGFALTLAACSSGGGGNNASNAQANNTATTETGQKLNTPTPPTLLLRQTITEEAVQLIQHQL